MNISHINPDKLHNNPAFSQAVVAEGSKTLYIGGQNGVARDGALAGDTFASQTEQALKNILVILESVGASQENVVKQTIFIVKGQDAREGYAATQKIWGNYPCAISAVFVEALSVEGALVEIEAVAVL